MNKIRVPFPKYLNAKRLFYKWEYDIVLASTAIAVSVFFTLLWIGSNVIIDLMISVAVEIIAFKYYKKFFKTKKKGWIDHVLYSKGWKKPIGDAKIKYDFEKSLLPYGFENEFKS